MAQSQLLYGGNLKTSEWMIFQPTSSWSATHCWRVIFETEFWKEDNKRFFPCNTIIVNKSSWTRHNTCWSVCLSVCWSVCLPVFLSLAWPVGLLSLYVYLSVGWHVCCLSVCPSFCLSVFLFVGWLVCWSICWLVGWFICLLVGLLVCLSVCLFFQLLPWLILQV